MTYVYCLHFEIEDDDDEDITGLSDGALIITGTALPTFGGDAVVFDEANYQAVGSFAESNRVTFDVQLDINNYAIVYVASARTVTSILSIFDNVNFIMGYTLVPNALSLLETADATPVAFDAYHLQNLATVNGRLELTIVIEDSNT